MVKIKYTARKSKVVSERRSVVTHPCRFPGCGKQFVFRQNMSRHMKNVHKTAAKSFIDCRLKNVSGDIASPERFDNEGEIFGAFQRAGAIPGTAEGELALNTLSEVADNIPTLYTLECGSTSHQSVADEVLIVSSDSDIDENPKAPEPLAPYPAKDEYDTLEPVKPNPTSYPVTKTAKCRRVSVKTSKIKTKGKAPQKAAKPRYVPGLPSGSRQSKGKDLRLTWEMQFESAHWPTQPAKVSSTDIVKVLHKFPKASSLDVAKTIVDHFEVTKNQAAAIRRRTASMVSMEQSILTKIRRLLPVAVDGDGAIAALRRIDEFLSTFEATDCSTPFE